MEKVMKRFLLLVLFIFLGAHALSAQNIDGIIDDLNDALGAALEEAVKDALKEQLSGLSGELETVNQAITSGLKAFVVGGSMMATIGNEWSDAYIGQITGFPPHFGVGASVGVAFLPLKLITAFSSTIGQALGSLGFPYLPLPGYAGEVRLGGGGIPFDVGLKFGILPNMSVSQLTGGLLPLSSGININYLQLGLDLRFSLVKERKFLPQISISPSYSFNRVGLDIATAGFNLLEAGGNYTIKDGLDNDLINVKVELPTSLGFSLDSHVLELKFLLSKKLIFIEPMIGISGMMTISNGTIGFKGGDVTWASADARFNVLDGSLSDYGLIFPSGGFSNYVSWGFRAFGGFGLTVWKLHLDMLGSYEVITGAFSLSVGFRVQI